jgi:4'-phosphopantetheinyl transferase
MMKKNRAARFQLARDREFFVAARGIRRELAGAYLKKAPSELGFQYGPEVKPSISPKNLDWPIQFNLSHAQGTALYDFACGREVGIDVEGIRSDFAGEAIAKHFFSADEVAELRALPAELQSEGFFTCWTRKEAYVKARGGGLQMLKSAPRDLVVGTFRAGAEGVICRTEPIQGSLQMHTDRAQRTDLGPK